MFMAWSQLFVPEAQDYSRLRGTLVEIQIPAGFLLFFGFLDSDDRYQLQIWDIRWLGM